MLEINKNYNPDNFFLAATRMDKFYVDKKFENQNFNILIIGDSFAEDLYNALNINRHQYKDVDFFYSEYNYNFISKDELIENSNLIIYSYDWNKNRLKNFKDNLEKIRRMNSNIAITSSSNEYKVPSRLYTLIDQKVLFDKKKFDYFGLKKIYFKNRLVHSKSNINLELKMFALKEKIKFLNREDFMCDVFKKECDYVDNEGNKLLYDYGHYTKFGAKFFGNKIYEINWLQLN